MIIKKIKTSYRRVICVLVLGIMGGFLYGQPPEPPPFRSGVVFVKFKPEAITEVAQTLSSQNMVDPKVRRYLQKIGFREARKVFKRAQPFDTTAIAITGEVVKRIDVSRWYTLIINEQIAVTDILDSLKALPGVEHVSPVTIYTPSVVPNDPEFWRQKGLKNGTTGRDIHATGAWDINKGRSDVKIAVMDGGVDYNHYDLDPGDRSRIIAGYDTGDDDSDPMDDLPDTEEGWGNHGTKVAGVIGAITDNDTGIAGIMWNTLIIPVKVATSGWGPFDWWANTAFEGDIADGIDWAASHGAYVINMSFGGEGLEWWEELFIGNPVGDAVWNAYNQGILLVGAMGNDNTDEPRYPAGFSSVMAVGATDLNDNRASFSNYGSHINVVAPGVSSGNYSTKRGNNYGYFGGTSCAAPMVSGAAGLIFSQSLDKGLNLTNDDVWHLLEVTADDIVDPADGAGTGRDEKTGYGRINVERALQYLEPPYTVTQATVSGGSSQLTWGSHTHTFYNNSGLPSGVYFGVKQYKVTWHVDFDEPYDEVPYLWIRDRQTVGWSGANPNLELPYANFTNVTTTGFDVETFVYWIGVRSDGTQINKYWPGNSNSIQASISYTAVGKSLPLSVTISGPSSLGYKETGTFTANVTGGAGQISYQWYRKNDGSSIWYTKGILQTQSETMAFTGFTVKVVVTRGNDTAEDTKYCMRQAWKVALPQNIPRAYNLTQNHPNPFNPVTVIRYDLPEDSFVQLRIYDLMGRNIRTLIDGPESAGFNRVVWDGKDTSGNSVPSGMYFYKLNALSIEAGEEFHKTRKMVLMR